MELPIELWCEVFTHLDDFPDLFRCMRVCKEWRKFIEEIKKYWHTDLFDCHRRILIKFKLNNYERYILNKHKLLEYYNTKRRDYAAKVIQDKVKKCDSYIFIENSKSLRIYTRNYNIMRIVNGCGGLMYDA